MAGDAPPSTLRAIKDAIDDRLAELAPAAAELRCLQTLLTAVDALQPPSAAPTARDGHGRHGKDGRAPQGANKRRILDTIRVYPGITAPEITELTGIKRTVVVATISRLRRAGEVEPADGGVRLRPRGPAHL